MTIPSTMRMPVFSRNHTTDFAEKPVPEPPCGELLVQVHANGHAR